MSPQSINPAAKKSQLSLPSSGDSPPSSPSAAAITFTKKQLFFPPKLISPPNAPVFNLSSATLCLHSAVSSSSQRLHKPKLQNRRNPSFPFHGINNIIINAFKGFAHHFSNFFLSQTPLPLLRRRNFVFSQLLCPHAIAQDNNQSPLWDSHNLQANLVVQLNKLNAFKRYKVSGIKFLNPRSRAVDAAASEAFGDILDLPRPGGVYTKQQLAEKLDYISSSGFFEKIGFEAQTNPDGSITVNIPFEEKLYPSKTKFSCISVDGLPELKQVELDANMTWKEQADAMRQMNEQYRRRTERAPGCILPDAVQEEIEDMMVKRTSFSGSLMKKITDKMMKWYRVNGYDAARVVPTTNPELNPGGEITFEMVEGKIDKLGLKFVDKMGNRVEGDTKPGVIKRAISNEVAVGKAFNQREFQRAMLNIGALGIFSPRPDVILNQDETSGAVSVEFVLQELQRKWCELETKWNITPGHNLLSSLLSATPSATLSLGHRNIKGLNRSIEGAVNISNLCDPLADDVGFNVEYKHPYLDGVQHPRNRTLNVVSFNSRKVSPVFRGVAGEDDAPIWVDRLGAKATITEDFSRQSKLTYGVVMEDIKTRGEGGEVVARAVTAAGNGPPTTLSEDGVDRMAFLQANITRDNTRFVNGVIVGERNVFQVDQGVGIGIKSPFFNRFKLWGTKFIPLKRVDESEGEAPPILVLHSLLGGCVGDLPNHEAFTIGGPHSVRGYDIGEIGASRNKLEVAAELRLPVGGEKYTGVKDAYVYAFGEHGNDLGSSVSLRGNPTNSFRRTGHGSSYGGGIKLSHVRFEYAVDHNAGKGCLSVNFGERF